MSDEQWVPGSKEELMAVIKREWDLLMDVVVKLDAAGKINTPDAGGWTPKDNLAHLAEWMNSLMGYHIDNRPAEEVMGLTKEQTHGWDMEVINPVLFERNRNRSFGEVMLWLTQTYEKLLAKLEGMSFEELMAPRDPNDPEKRPLLLWIIGDTSDHFAEHRATIAKML